MGKKTFRPIVDAVDVSNWVHRAFFASQDLRTRTGIPTGAIKTFSNMLNALILENTKVNKGRTFVICCLDIQTEKTFRYMIQKEWVDGHRKRAKLIGLYGKREDKSPYYKGNRDKDPEKSESIKIQMEYIRQALIARGIPTFKKEPWEADDLIGHFSSSLPGCLTRIQSRDKDFAQLVKDGECMLIMPQQANAAREELDEAGCFAKFGVTPKQMIHYLMLCGDSVDNIPGIPGVGAKTAAAYLKIFGTMGNMYRNRTTFKGVGVAAKLLRGDTRGLPPFRLTKKLATIPTNIEGLPTDWRELEMGSPNRDLKKLKKKLQFKELFGDQNGANIIIRVAQRT